MQINKNASQIRLNGRKYLGRPKLSNSEVVAPDKTKDEEEEEYLYQNNPAIHVLDYFHLFRLPHAGSKRRGYYISLTQWRVFIVVKNLLVF